MKPMKKKILGLFLAAVMILSFIPAIAIPTFADDNVSNVYNESQLVAALNTYGTDPSHTFKLKADITLSDNYTPNYVYGLFDGQFHTVYNLQGTFLWPAHNAVIQNFTVSDKTAPNGPALAVTGAKSLFGSLEPGDVLTGETVKIQQVENQRGLTWSSNRTGGFFNDVNIGGTAYIRRCVNSADYIGNPNYNHKIGGFVGTMSNGTLRFQYCTNSGNISASQAGGLLGVYSAGVTVIMEGCTNTGTITGFCNGTAYGVAGGMIGGFNNGGSFTSGVSVSLTDCTNRGNILLDSTANNTKAFAIGGLIGTAGSANADVTYTISMTGCAVCCCTIDATDNDYTHGNVYAAPFLGKIAPKSYDGVTVNATNCYASIVGVSAQNNKARVAFGVNNATGYNQVTETNCIFNGVVEYNANGQQTAWNADWWDNVVFTPAPSDDNGYADNDDDDLISDNLAPLFEVSAGNNQTTDFRFIATLKNVTPGAYSNYGFFVTWSVAPDPQQAPLVGDTLRITTDLTTGTYYNGVYKTASQLYPGHTEEEYVFTATVEGVSNALGNVVTFYVTPYIVEWSGDIIFGQTGSVRGGGIDSTTPISVMSYNLKDGAWLNQSATQRKVGLAKTIALKNPEIVCVQEANQLSASVLASACASNGTRTYSTYQVHHTAVMWDSSLYTKLTGGSVDCTVPTSNGGDGYTRICTWVKLKRNADNAIFYVVSAHFDLNKPGTSADTLITYINQNFGTNARVIMAGDLNANEARWLNIAQMKNAGYNNADTEYTDFLTNHNIKGYEPYRWTDMVGNTTAADNGLAVTHPSNGAILDWCYYTAGSFHSSNFEVITTKVYWSYFFESISFWHSGSCTDNPSDHYPIYAKFTLQ